MLSFCSPAFHSAPVTALSEGSPPAATWLNGALAAMPPVNCCLCGTGTAKPDLASNQATLGG